MDFSVDFFHARASAPPHPWPRRHHAGWPRSPHGPRLVRVTRTRWVEANRPWNPPFLSSTAMPVTASPTYYEALAADPELMRIEWDLPETLKFIKLAQYLRPYLSSMLRFADSHVAPPHLPTMVHDFFKFSLDISDEQVKVAWDGLREAIWKKEVDDVDDPILAFSKVSEYAQDLLIHGIVRGIGTSAAYISKAFQY